MAKKFLFKLICLVIILAVMTLAAASCGNDGSGSTDNTTAPSNDNGDGDTGGDTPNGQQEQVERYQFPADVDFGGYNMRIVTQDRSDWAWSEMSAEEEDGDPINDAIFTRNTKVEQELNITITEFHVSDSPGRARRAIQAGTDEYDVVFTDSSQAGNLASQGMYINLYNVPGLYLEKPWWNQNAHQSAELLGKLYFTTSDANLVTNDAIWVVYFNKKILRDHGMADPYQLVRDNQWTIDVFYEMARDAARDVDGDGVWTVADQWGISTHNLGFLAFFICLDQQMISLNEDGEPYLVAPNERFVSAFMKAARLMDAQGGLYLHAQGSYPGRTPDLDHARKTFIHDMSLFCTEVLSHARAFREMEADFGLLPHPKYDSNQEQYLTFMIDTVPAFGIPVTVADVERTGIFMEALTGVSAETIMPAYYDVSLHGKFTRDEESIEMLDIIRDGRVFDLAVLYNWGGYYGAIIDNGVSNSPNPVTVYERLEGRVAAAIQQTLDRFRELD